MSDERRATSDEMGAPAGTPVRRLCTGALGISALALALCSAPATAQDARLDTVTVEQRVLVAGDLTPAEARRRAIDGALGEAVRRVVGIRVQSGELSVTEDRAGTGGTIRDGFVSVVQLDAAGRAVDYRILDERWVPTQHPELGAQLYFAVRAHVTVARDLGEPDTGFRVSVELNDALFHDDGGGLEENDELIARIASTRDGYVSVFGIAEDTVQVLLPNDVMGGGRISAGRPVEFPSADWRAQGVHLRAQLPDGRERRRELIAVVVTRGHVPPPTPADGEHLTPLDLQRWLAAIPVEQRGVAFAAHEVRRR